MLNFIIGFLIGWVLAWLGFFIYNQFRKQPEYSGIMKVIKTATGKTFSLELHRDPEELEHEETVTFKVITPEE